MGKTTLSNDDINKILHLYQTEISSTHKLGELFRVGHKKISKILTDNGIKINIRGGQISHGVSKQISTSKITKIVTPEDKKMIVICKKTGISFDDINNLSGSLTNHIINTYGDIPIPTNTYQRKKYELEYGKKWFEEYFTLKEIDKDITRKCKYCNWETKDLSNKTGCLEQHLKMAHNKSMIDFISEYPDELILHSSYSKKIELGKMTNHVICQICDKKLGYLTNTHLEKHGLDMVDYKLKFPNAIIISNNYKEKLIKTYNNGLKFHEQTFTSKPQIELFNYIKSLGMEVKKNDKQLLNGVEIDILIPEKKIGIEYNGLYYHSENMGKSRLYHLNKTRLMNNIGYGLIHIFEDEWLNNKELIKNKISHLLNKNQSVSIGARKCKIREISKEEKNYFLKVNHIQGKVNSKIRLGAFYDDMLVSVMTFDGNRNMSLIRNNVDGEYELTRFATNINFRVVGVADKLLKYFINTFKPKKIISFGDVRWVLNGGNNMYTKLGFKLVKTLSPDYRYYNPKIARNKRLHKFGFGKNSLKKRFPNLDFSKTEKELTTELGYDRIWDCGLFKYELIVSN